MRLTCNSIACVRSPLQHPGTSVRITDYAPKETVSFDSMHIGLEEFLINHTRMLQVPPWVASAATRGLERLPSSLDEYSEDELTFE